MTKKKESIYRQFIGHLEDTISKEYYFEAAWIEYVLLEDRLVSLLKNSGGVPPQPKGRPLMMGGKIKILSDRMLTNQVLNGHLMSDNLLNRLGIWKEERNVLMHSMADGSLSIDDIQDKIINLASTGAILVRDFASAARRVKHHSK